MTNRFVTIFAAAMLFTTTLAADDNFNKTGASGKAVIVTSQDMELYDQYHFSPAYRAGDFVFFSRVVAEPPGDNPATPEEFQEGLHKTFSAIKATLAAAGARFDQVIKLTTFHVFDSPHFVGDKVARIGAFGHRMPNLLIDGSGDLAALDMRERNIQVTRRHRSRHGFEPISHRQDDVRPQVVKNGREFAETDTGVRNGLKMRLRRSDKARGLRGAQFMTNLRLHRPAPEKVVQRSIKVSVAF